MVRGAQMSGYDLWGPHPNDCPPDIEFEFQEKNPQVYGEFVWTGFDYIGEPDPCAETGGRISYFGIFDLCGFPKDRYWLYKAHWRPDVPTAHILPHWNWEGCEGEVTPVHVYTSGDEAELFVNGSYLTRVFRERTGCTPMEFHNRTRCEAAKEMLKNPELSVSYISDTVGYSTQAHFSRVFKEQYGVSPARYRKERSEKGADRQ